jgi:hypothetical protein
LLLRAAGRSANLGAITTGLMRLLHRYGSAELRIAIREALDGGVPHPNAVRLALERRREQRGKAATGRCRIARRGSGTRCAGTATCARHL